MFSNNLRRIREEHGLSRLQLARKSGLSYKAIEFLEKEQRKPRLSTAMKIAGALNVQIDDLAK